MQKLHFNFRHIFVSLAITTFLLSPFLVFTQKTFAATGINRTINFQGRLVNNTTGLNVSNGSYSVVFTLYNNPTAGQGTALWTETQNVTTTDGIFRVALGSVTAIPANFNFNWDGLYLGIKVGSDAEMTPRIQMASVPFAFNSQQVAGLTVLDSTSGAASTSATLKIGTSGGPGVTPITVDLGVNNLTFTTSGVTALTLPTGGTLLTNTATAIQTVTSTQATGTVLGIADSTGLTGAITGLNIALSGTGAQNQSGLTFNLSGATGTTLNDITGTAGSWSVTKGGALTVASCSGCGGVNYWAINNGLLYNANLTTDFAIGGTSSTSAKFLISQNGTMPTASVSAKTSFAGLVVDQAGVGDIFTASAAGTTRFRIAQNGSILMQGNSVTAIGNIGTAAPSQTNDYAVVNGTGDQGSLVPNAGFESAIGKTTFADGWVLSSTTSATVTRDTASVPPAAQGNASLLATTTSTNQVADIYSACIPISPQSYTLSYWQRGSVAAGLIVRLYIKQYTSQLNCQANGGTVSTTTFAASTALTTSFAQVTGALTVVAGTTWGRVDILIGGPTSGRTASVDGVRLVATGVGTGLDYAENYPADPSNIPQPGDVVSLDNLGNLAEVTLAGKPMDDSVIGVVSTNPGEVLGPDVPDPKVAVALSGRTPVKVSSENGPIQIGDYLASSDIPGVAVKAITAGPVIGVAMENYANPDPANIGSITAFIKNTYYNGGSLASNTGLTSENGKDIILPLAANGSFIIKNSSGASLAMFNANGNATFSGTLTVDNLKTNQIAGLDIISNQLADLTNQVASLSANLAVLSASTQSASLPQASMSSLLNLADLNVNGLATVSADLSVGGNGLIQGALSVLNNITTQNLLVSQFAYFINDVVFRGNVRFNSPPTFNSDTAGFAVIKKDSDNVQVAFTQEYADVPVVTASIALNKLGDDAAQKQLEDAVLNGNLSFVLTQRTTKGFVIRLNKPSPEDINFSWIALSIKDAKVSGLDSLPAVIPTATNSAAFQSIINQLNNSSGNGGGG